MLSKANKDRPDLIICYKPEILPIGILLRSICGTKIVYDPRELSEGQDGVTGVRKQLVKFTERLLIPFAGSMLVVSELIRKWYSDRYPNYSNIFLVRNNSEFPVKEHSRDTPRIREQFGIGDDEILFVYCGGLSKNRGMEFLCEVFAELPEYYHIGFLGSGPSKEYILDQSEKNVNIHYLGLVAPEMVIPVIEQCDIGIFIYAGSSLSDRFCLPNKFFQYLAAGIPVFIGDYLEELAGIVNRSDIGWIAGQDRSSVHEKIIGIDRKDLESKQSAVENIKNIFDPAIDRREFVKACQQALPGL